ncbi:MAG: LysM peptidoglycan-binding domain-containing protein [Pseudomonadota bacterium]
MTLHTFGRCALLAAAALVAGCQTAVTATDGEPAPASPAPSTAAVAVEPAVTPPAPPAHSTPLPTAPKPAPAAPAPPPDLWQVLRAGFVLPEADRKSVDQHARWFADHPGYLDRVFTRARPYMHFIVEELARRDMPLELALLPVVESAFDPFAYSHGRAAGLWQFIPGTARRFDLKASWWYDGRRDVVASSLAAMDYLTLLHDTFDGDWLLAVAAYNAGEGTVGKALRRNRRADKPADFWNIKVPKETRAYVPRLLALKRVVADPGRFGVTLPALPYAAGFARVDTGGQIDIAVAAGMAGVDVDALYRLNPGFNRWATDPDGPHVLNVPVDAAEAFRTALAALPPEQRVRWTRYTIKPGDTLSTIASRHRTTTRRLKEANKLRGTTIRAGAHLMIPTASAAQSTYALSLDGRAADARARHDPDALRHRVRSGESLWTISRRYGVGVRELARWNAMAPGDTLGVGTELVIARQRAGASPSAAPGLAPEDSARVRRVRYTVRKGDSLSRIGSRFRVKVSDLREWNRLDGQKYLQPGQTIVMYVDVTQQSTGG